MSQDQNDDEHIASTPAQEAPKASTAPVSGRNKRGRFEKGFTGNAKGRPRRAERAWSNRQWAADILSEANAEVAVTRNGKTELVPMYQLIIRQLLIKATKSDNLRQIITALNFFERAQSSRESKDWKFYQELEQVEKSFEEFSELASETIALEHRDKWRKRSRRN